MAVDVQPFTITFPDGFDERAEFELPYRGYLPGVMVSLRDGSRHPLAFIDLARLGQGLGDREGVGRPFYAERGLVILPEVTAEAIRAAVQGLWEEGYFAEDASTRGEASPDGGG